MGLRGSPEVARRTGPPESIFGDVDFRLRQKKHFTHKICDIVLNFERLYSQKRYLNRWNPLNPVLLPQNDRYIKQIRGIQSKSTAGEKKTETKSNVAQKSVASDETCSRTPKHIRVVTSTRRVCCAYA